MKIEIISTTIIEMIVCNKKCYKMIIESYKNNKYELNVIDTQSYTKSIVYMNNINTIDECRTITMNAIKGDN